MALIKRIINMKKTNKEILEEIIKDEIFLFEYTAIDNISSEDYDPKLTVKIGKRIDKNISTLLQTDDGIKELKSLLDMSDIRLNFVAARYLYPLDPKFYTNILMKYKKSLKEDINIYEVETLMSGLSKKQKVFIDQYKKLYGEDRFEDLNKLK